MSGEPSRIGVYEELKSRREMGWKCPTFEGFHENRLSRSLRRPKRGLGFPSYPGFSRWQVFLASVKKPKHTVRVSILDREPTRSSPLQRRESDLDYQTISKPTAIEPSGVSRLADQSHADPRT
jgi:hypothetical protein